MDDFLVVEYNQWHRELDFEHKQDKTIQQWVHWLKED